VSEPEVFKVHNGAPVKAWIKGVQLETAALNQLLNVSQMPFIHKHVAVMPDVHHGIGATVGSVIATKGAIIPASVGVDIGCGMMAVRTNLIASDLPDNLAGVRSAIEAAVPHGRTDNGNPATDKGAHREKQGLGGPDGKMGLRLAAIVEKHPKLERARNSAFHHLGTLGTGNHFIEVCIAQDQAVWVMLHSGSRGIGNAIGTYFIEKAKEEMRRWFINLPDQNLAYLPQGSQHFDDYVEAVHWAQEYALENRAHMMDATIEAVGDALGRPIVLSESAVNCHHNYVAIENHFGANVFVTRKGAVRAREGDLGIIPGSMGARSFIVRGKGNPESFCSCSHGAGRKMSRTQAQKVFTLEDHAAATAGVECRKDASVLDETPAAYKDIDAVMAAQSDLVEIVHTLKQVVCVKG
jgi:tRNA-splicing ligase RtcB